MTEATEIALWRGGAAAGRGGRCHGCGEAQGCNRSLRGCRHTRAAKPEVAALGARIAREGPAIVAVAAAEAGR